MRRLRPPTLRTTEQPAEHARPSVPANSTGLLAGAVTSAQTAITQESTWTYSDFTTTNTTDYQDLATVNIVFPYGNSTLFFWSTVQISHSAAAAEVSAKTVLSRSDGSTAIIGGFDNYYLPTADRKAFITYGHALAIPANLSLVEGGTRTLTLKILNHTAGTLTVWGSTPNVYGRTIIAFVTGDASV